MIGAVPLWQGRPGGYTGCALGAAVHVGAETVACAGTLDAGRTSAVLGNAVDITGTVVAVTCAEHAAEGRVSGGGEATAIASAAIASPLLKT